MTYEFPKTYREHDDVGDLVQILRAIAKVHICEEAADEIERLRAENTAVLLANRLLVERDAKLTAEIERLRAALAAT